MFRMLFMLVLCSLVGAEEVVLFETSFQGLPVGWFNSEWGFQSGDAHIDEFVNHWSGDFSADMYTDGEPPALYFVPDGTDSVAIHIEHDIYMGGEDIKAFVEVTSTSGKTYESSKKSSSGAAIAVLNPFTTRFAILSRIPGWDSGYTARPATIPTWVPRRSTGG